MNGVSFFFDTNKKVWAVIMDYEDSASIIVHHHGRVWLQLKRYTGRLVFFTNTFIDGTLYTQCVDERYSDADHTRQDEMIAFAINSILEDSINEYSFSESFDKSIEIFADDRKLISECYALLDYEALDFEVPLPSNFLPKNM